MTTNHTAVASPDRFAGEHPSVRRSVELIGEILAGTAQRNDTAGAFLTRCLGASLSTLISESVDLTASTELPVSAVLADLIAEHHPPTGPGAGSAPPNWQRLIVDGLAISVPKSLSAYFAAGTLAPRPTIVRIGMGDNFRDGIMMQVYASADGGDDAKAVLDDVMSRARGERNFLRGKVLHATGGSELRFDVTELPVSERSNLVLPEEVWRELDTNVAALTSRANLMRELGLGTRRGVLIAGPPGVGKSAVSRVIAAELAGRFTVIIVDARAASSFLRDVYRETRNLSPCVIVLEDIDLYVGNRSHGDRGSTLAEFLSVLDGSEAFEDVLTLASTNDPKALDSAATRSARFDSVIHLDYLSRGAVEQVLKRLLAPLELDEIDCGAATAELGDEVTGADLREIVRRAVLEHGHDLTTERLRRVIANGRWNVAELTGQYL